jgi:hypothetical protein
MGLDVPVAAVYNNSFVTTQFAELEVTAAFGRRSNAAPVAYVGIDAIKVP